MCIRDSEYIVTEAARAINDDWSIEASLADLAATLDESRFSDEALVRRAINANVRVGDQLSLDRLINFAERNTAPAEMRAEALAALAHWAEPSLHDRVDGRYRGVVKRDKAPVIQAMASKIGTYLSDAKSEVVIAGMQIAGQMGMTDQSSCLLYTSPSPRDATLSRMPSSA